VLAFPFDALEEVNLVGLELIVVIGIDQPVQVYRARKDDRSGQTVKIGTK
jgi:hypothetical protein